MEDSPLDGYVTVGAVALTLISGVLQALLLCCFPNYRHHVVSELVKPRFSMDAAAFPQVYQRDEGAHLHLGVLLPGFSQRDNLSMTVRRPSTEQPPFCFEPSALAQQPIHANLKNRTQPN